jgi:hypothetical protein
MRTITSLALTTLFCLGCGGGTTPGNDLSTGGDLAKGGDLAMAGGDDLTMAADLAGADLAGGGGMVTLTLKNYLAWCSVSVNGGQADTLDHMLMFQKGAMVNLTGDKASNVFVWGYWAGNGVANGKDTGMAITVNMDADHVVQACCPFANDPNTPCPAP